jgi:haloacetate dehalogenase
MMKTSKITVPRGTFNVREAGNPDGDPVVMVHGWPESSYTWEPVSPFLSGKFRVIAPDLRGLGDSERTLNEELYQKRELAKDVIEILDALHIKDIFLVGHDWGGNVVQEMAFAVPERIKKLVLMNFPILSNSAGNEKAAQVIMSQGSVALMYQYFQQQKGLPEAMIKGNEDVWIRWCFSGSGGAFPPEMIEEYIRCYKIEDTPVTGANYYRNMRRDRKRWRELSGRKLPMPTLYIYGNKDRVVIPEYLTGMESSFDQVEVQQIDAGHFVHEEYPEQVGRLIKDFLER